MLNETKILKRDWFIYVVCLACIILAIVSLVSGFSAFNFGAESSRFIYTIGAVLMYIKLVIPLGSWLMAIIALGFIACAIGIWLKKQWSFALYLVLTLITSCFLLFYIYFMFIQIAFDNGEVFTYILVLLFIILAISSIFRLRKYLIQ